MKHVKLFENWDDGDWSPEDSGETPISQMTRQEMLDFLGIDPKFAEEFSDQDLMDAVIDKNADTQ